MTRPVRRVAVVTGGAGAIGGSVAAALTAADHQVVIMDRTGDVPVDLGDEGQVRAAAQRVLDQAGRCDVLVHAAAAFDRADLARLDLAVWRRVQAVNVESALLLAQAFVPGMAARGFGRIIFVVSDTVLGPARRGPAAVRDQQGRAGRAGSGAGRGARPGRDRGHLRGPRADRHPGRPGRDPAAAFEAVRARQALPRALVPGDVAATVAFLASDVGRAHRPGCCAPSPARRHPPAANCFSVTRT